MSNSSITETVRRADFKEDCEAAFIARYGYTPDELGAEDWGDIDAPAPSYEARAAARDEAAKVQPFSLSAAQTRNRRIFMKALAGGVTVLSRTGDTGIVTSASRPGHIHHVTRTLTERNEIAERCDCEWGNKVGWLFKSDKHAQPCAHMLVNRYDLMPQNAKDALLDMDSELAAVAAPYGLPAEKVAA